MVNTADEEQVSPPNAGERPPTSAELANANQVVAQAEDGTVFYLYKHQAGGHKPFLRSADGSVCKPAIALELQFYQALDSQYPQLKPFVPAFVGKVSVELNLSPTPCGSTAAAAAIAPVVLHRTQSKSPRIPHPSTTGKKRRLVRSASAALSEQPRAGGAAGYSATLWRKELSAANPTTTATGPLQDYLVLGNLTRGFRRPCVLDIKMGTRQHGEDAPPAKAMSHAAKCAATTSLELGLRLCGMQIYDTDLDEYLLWDKHWGRQLTADDIAPALATYLSCGEELHWSTLERLLHKVVAMRAVIEQTHGLRFWGSSLLLIYEGDCRMSPSNEDVRLIDFAHCQMSAGLESPDEGLLLGLANIARFLQELLATRDDTKHFSAADAHHIHDGQ